MMWPIVGCSLLAVTLFLERLFHLHRAQIRYSVFLKGIYNILRRKNLLRLLASVRKHPDLLPIL